MARALLALGIAALVAACSGPPPVRPAVVSSPPPDALTSCHEGLSVSGALFQVLNPVRTKEGCGFDEGVRITASPSSLNQPAILSCPTALALARFDLDVVQPAAQRHFGKRVTKIHHVGAYSCRGIAGRRKWSQHAFGQAIDVIGFEIAGGTRITVARDWRSRGAKADFLQEVARGACTVFRVVLTPAYDRAHHDHFHLDVGPERLCAI